MSYFPIEMVNEWLAEMNFTSKIILLIFVVIGGIVWYLGYRSRNSKLRFVGFCIAIAGVFLWMGIQTMRGIAKFKTNATFAFLATILVPIPSTFALLTNRRIKRQLGILQLVVIIALAIGELIARYWLII